MAKSRLHSQNLERSGRRALESRVLLDAAAVETAIHVLSSDSTNVQSDSQAPDLLDALGSGAQKAHSVYFIDSRVEGYEKLLGQVPSGAQVFVLDQNHDGLEQINHFLSGLDYKVEAVSIVSHGADGVISIGDSYLDSANLSSYKAQLESLGSHLAEGGDLLLYGCDVAQGDVGQHFIHQLSDITGADVAASTDLTGLHGDWDLEAQTGTIEASPWDALHQLQTDLNLDMVHVGNEAGGTGSGRYMDGSAEWVAVGEQGTGQVRVYSVNGASHPFDTITAPTGTSITWTSTFGQGVAMSGDVLAIADPNAGTYGAIAIYQHDASSDSWVYRNSIDIASITD